MNWGGGRLEGDEKTESVVCVCVFVVPKEPKGEGGEGGEEGGRRRGGRGRRGGGRGKEGGGEGGRGGDGESRRVGIKRMG